MLPSAWFPDLNPGFLVITPAPYPTEAQATEARREGPRSAQSYVKRAWRAVDPCVAH